MASNREASAALDRPPNPIGRRPVPPYDATARSPALGPVSQGSELTERDAEVAPIVDDLPRHHPDQAPLPDAHSEP